MNQALENLKAVLCDINGTVCFIHGSDGDLSIVQESLAELEELLTLPKDVNKLIDQGMEIYECLRTAEAEPSRVEQIYFDTCNALHKLQVHNFILSAKACLVEDGILLSDAGEPYCRFYFADKEKTPCKLFKAFSMGQKVRRRGDVPDIRHKRNSYKHGEVCDCRARGGQSEIYSVRWNNGQIENYFLPDNLERDD